MLRKIYLVIGITLFSVIFNALSAQSEVIISEFMAINEETLQDSNGKYSDWIEIYNTSDQSVNLLGWSLTDDPTELSKWIFPSTTLGPNEYLLIFASGEARAFAGQELHTNFKLSGSGEYLALINPNKTSITTEFNPAYPSQTKDISFGLLNGVYTALATPTPASANTGNESIMAPVFSKSRGIYTQAFSLTITSPSSNASIYYTTDGTIPTPENSIEFSSDIEISKSTVISAIAVNSNSEVSSVITNTYIFTESVLNQPNEIEGYPAVWGKSLYSDTRLAADYEVDQEISKNEKYQDDLITGLSDIPSLCLVTTPDHLFSLTASPSTGGIYIYTGKTSDGSFGTGWERPTSMEYFNPKNGQNFQVNCGVLLHGGNSRVPDNSPKHSLRLSFRSEYGPSKLHFDFFKEKRDPTNEFNALVLRSGYNYSWVKNSFEQNQHADFIRDPFTKHTLLDMGNKGAHNRFVNLYINGLYWGVYNVSEKLTNDFMESYMNGKEGDWDVVKDHNGIVDGSRTMFNYMMTYAASGLSDNAKYQKLQGLNLDGTINSSYENYLDVDNFIDYMLLNFFIGNKDWDGNNWIAARNKVETKHGFRYFSWDAETSMLSEIENLVSMVDGDPTKLWSYLSNNSEFKLRVADRIQKHFFNGGALTVEENKKRYQELVDEINLAIVGESARWGDYRRDVISDKSADLYTRDQYWLVEVDNQLNSYLPKRTNVVFNQLRSKGFYPALKAPEFNSYEEDILSTFEFTITNPNSNGTVYYTTDGSDPRLFGGEIANNASTYKTPLTIVGKGKIKARVKYNSTWSALSTGKFKGDTASFVMNVHQLASLHTNCYPNPASIYTNLKYNLTSAGVVNISLRSIDGKIVKQYTSNYQTAGNQTYRIDVTDLKSGIYLIELNTNEVRYRGKLMVH